MMTATARQLAPTLELQCLDIGAFLSIQFPPRQYVLNPVLPCRGLSMIYAYRGIGKTFLGLSIGYAVASGGEVMKWSAPRPRRVLLLDGEMPSETLQRRLAAIARGSATAPSPDHFRILAADGQELGLPDLSSPKGQEALDPFLQGVDLLILDNLSTLCRSGKENEGESWIPVQEWLLRLRRQGVAVLLIHHAGKGGNQRGTSKREDVLDTVIALRRPPDYEPDQGARFEVHFEKARGMSGDDALPLDARLILDDDTVKWSWQPLVDAKASAVEAMLQDGVPLRDIAEETGMSKSAVHRVKDKMKREGRING
jgi:putative DNA primase/helicase